MQIEFTQTQQPTGKFSPNNFGARYLDPMLGMWISVDPARQFASPYLYAGNGMNPTNVIDPDGNSDIVSLRPGTNDINNVTHIDDAFNLVALVSNGSTEYYDAPPAESYFYTENLIGQKFDPNMEANANVMMNSWFNENKWTQFNQWGTGGLYDFKSRFYENAENTVGFVNKTMMTARDVGNALWGGVTSYQYGLTWRQMHMASDGAAGWGAFEKPRDIKGWIRRSLGTIGCGVSIVTCEDYSSRVMQDWGYLRDFGKPH